MRGPVIALSLLVMMLPSHADTPGGEVVGMGAATCAQMGEMYAENTRETEMAVRDWALGFMSGLEFVRLTNGVPTKLVAASHEEIFDYVRAQCAQRPLETVWSIVAEFYRSLPTEEE